MSQSNHDLPKDEALPPVQDLIKGRPASWQGMPIEWSSLIDPKPVFLGKFALKDEKELVYLFGARYSLSEALVEGESLGDDFFVEFFVLEKVTQGSWNLHRLLQNESVTYSECSEPRDYAPAQEIDDPAALSIHNPPAWKVTEALWPTCGGTPMHFVGQIELTDTDVMQELFMSDFTVFLFWSPAKDSNCFKLVEQETTAQTAHEHYEFEERIETD